MPALPFSIAQCPLPYAQLPTAWLDYRTYITKAIKGSARAKILPPFPLLNVIYCPARLRFGKYILNYIGSESFLKNRYIHFWGVEGKILVKIIMFI